MAKTITDNIEITNLTKTPFAAFVNQEIIGYFATQEEAKAEAIIVLLQGANQ
jgi:hypothetical protein